MKKILFLRPAIYLDLIPGMDLISSFDLNGLQLNDPLLDTNTEKTIKRVKNLKKNFKIKYILSSPVSRCVQTAKLFDLPIKILPELKEIKFSVANFVTPENKDFNVNLLRENVVKSIVEDKNEEKVNDVIARIDSFFKKLKKIPNGSVCISHAFVMKFFEILFLNDMKIENANIFIKNYDWKIKPYDFLEGFCVSLDKNGRVLNVEKV